MTHRVALFAAAAISALAVNAHAQIGSPIRSPLQNYSSSSGAGANCPGTIALEVNFIGGQNCKDGNAYSGYTVLPGLTDNPGTLSGAGYRYKTGITSAGIVQNFPSGYLRITPDGVVNENGVTESMPYTENFSGSSWLAPFNSTLTVNAGVAPDASDTATAFTATGSNAQIGDTGIAQVPSTQRTYSIFAHSGSTTGVGIRVSNGTDFVGINCSTSGSGCSPIYFSAGNPYTNYTGGEVSLGNGNYRVWLTYTTPATTGQTTTHFIFPGPTGAATSGSELIWGANDTLGPLASYVYAGGVPVTLTADTYSQAFTPPVNGFCAVYFLTKQSLVPCVSPISLGAANTTWGQNPVNEILAQTTEPEPLVAHQAGYDSLTFDMSSFTTGNVDSTGSKLAGYKAYLLNWFGYSQTPVVLTFNSDTTVTSEAQASGGGSLTSAAWLSGTSPYFRGTLFGGGGYFEATFQILNPTAINVANGWPSFYLFSGNHIRANGLSAPSFDHWPGLSSANYLWFEPDITEYFYTGYGNNPNCYVHASHMWSITTQTITNTNNAYTQDYNCSVSPSIVSGYHTYGELWIPATDTVPGSISAYFDGILWDTPITFTKMQTSLAAGASFSTSSPTITMSGPNPGEVQAYWTVVDQNNGATVGAVSSWSGSTLTLQANAASASVGASDTLVFTAAPIFQAAAAAITPPSLTITMSGTNPGPVAAGWAIYDQSINATIGTVQSWVGTTITLQTYIYFTGAGTNDKLMFLGPWQFGAIDLDKFAFSISGSSDSGIKIKNIRAWQRDATKNLSN